jgi:hypothetical protein
VAVHKVLIASRTNAIFPIPTLYDMVPPSHFSFSYIDAGVPRPLGLLLIVIVLVALVEMLALGVFAAVLFCSGDPAHVIRT